jgi:hypothetical protein
MKTNFSSKQVRIAAACGLALCAMSASAQVSQPPQLTPILAPQEERALVINTPGQVWMNSYGDCWHSQFGPAPAPGLPCGQPIAQLAPPPAPAPYVAPAPAQAQYVAPAPAPYVAPAPLPVRVPRN